MTVTIIKKPLPTHSMTLADLIKLIEKLPAKTTRQQGHHAEAISALRRIAVIAGRTPEDIPATQAAIDKLLAGINPVLANLTTGGFYNLKSRVRRAFRLLGYISKKPTVKVELTPAWKVLVEALPDGHCIKIGRFAKFCCRNGIAPDAVSEVIFTQFRIETEAASIAKDAMKLAQATAGAWNYGHRHVQGWPGVLLAVPSNAKPPFVLPLDTFPKGLLLDHDVWFKRVRDAGEGDAHAPTKPYRKATIEGRTFDCRYAASALVKMGVPQTEIVSLATLMKPANIDKVLGFIEDRLGTATSPTKIRILVALLGFAKYGPTACRKFAGAIEARLKQAEQKSGRKRVAMTENNRRRVIAFKDPSTVRRLLSLPATLMKLADAVEKPNAETARQAATAVAIEMLFADPMRAENLYGLDLERHFQTIGHGQSSQMVVHIDGSEVKNGLDRDFLLPKSTKALMLHFVKRYRPILLKTHGQPNGTCFLFPGTEGGQLKHGHAWMLLGNATLKHVGVRLSTHHFRHVIAYLILAQKPGAYELVAKVLGHADATTTKRFYTGVEHMAAIEHFQQVIRGSGAFGRPIGKTKTNGAF